MAALIAASMTLAVSIVFIAPAAILLIPSKAFIVLTTVVPTSPISETI